MHVTLNTNHAGNTEAEVNDVINALRRFIQHDLAKIENWRELLIIEPDFDAVENVLVDAIGIEVGGKRHFIHVHFLVTVEHHGRMVVRGRGSQRPWQNLLRARIPYLRGAYASVTLHDSRALNYAAKTGEGDEQIVVHGIQEPVVF